MFTKLIENRKIVLNIIYEHIYQKYGENVCCIFRVTYECSDIEYEGVYYYDYPYLSINFSNNSISLDEVLKRDSLSKKEEFIYTYGIAYIFKHHRNISKDMECYLKKFIIEDYSQTNSIDWIKFR